MSTAVDWLGTCRPALRRWSMHRPAPAILISGLVLAALALQPAYSRPRPGTCLRVINVESWDFLYIREKPDHRSRKVGAIRPDTRNRIKVSGPCTPNTENKRRLWCPVEYNVLNNVEIQGYIKMYYTEETACR